METEERSEVTLWDNSLVSENTRNFLFMHICLKVLLICATPHQLHIDGKEERMKTRSLRCSENINKMKLNQRIHTLC